MTPTLTMRVQPTRPISGDLQTWAVCDDRGAVVGSVWAASAADAIAIAIALYDDAIVELEA